LPGLSFDAEKQKASPVLLLPRQEASADTEIMQLRGDGSLASEREGIGPREQLPAQIVGQHKRAHRHGAKGCRRPRLRLLAQVSKTARKRLVRGGRLEFPKEHRQFASEVLPRHLTTSHIREGKFLS
jgi:hypothetical protein